MCKTPSTHWLHIKCFMERKEHKSTVTQQTGLTSCLQECLCRWNWTKYGRVSCYNTSNPKSDFQSWLDYVFGACWLSMAVPAYIIKSHFIPEPVSTDNLSVECFIKGRGHKFRLVHTAGSNSFRLSHSRSYSAAIFCLKLCVCVRKTIRYRGHTWAFRVTEKCHVDGTVLP